MLSLVTAATSVVSVVLAVILAIRARQRKRITFTTLFDQPLSDPTWKDLTLALNDEPLKSPRQVGVLFRNTGNVALTGGDIAAPLGVSLADQGRFVHAVATEFSEQPRGREMNVERDSGSVTVPITLLNAGDALLIQAILDGAPQESELLILGKANGFKILDATDPTEVAEGIGRLRGRWRKHRTAILSVCVLAALLTTYLVAHQRDQPPLDGSVLSPLNRLKIEKVDTDPEGHLRIKAVDSPEMYWSLSSDTPPTYWSFAEMGGKLIPSTRPCEAPSAVSQISCQITSAIPKPGQEVTSWVAIVPDDMVAILENYARSELPMETPDSVATHLSDPVMTTIGQYVLPR